MKKTKGRECKKKKNQNHKEGNEEMRWKENKVRKEENEAHERWRKRKTRKESEENRRKSPNKTQEGKVTQEPPRKPH